MGGGVDAGEMVGLVAGVAHDHLRLTDLIAHHALPQVPTPLDCAPQNVRHVVSYRIKIFQSCSIITAAVK